MKDDRVNIQSILLKADKPARYVGGEYNESVPDLTAPLQYCMCFPDVYEVAMSNLGIRILQDILTHRADASCERCFTPWPDFGDMLKEKKLPLYALESKRPLADFDMLGFSLQYELSTTNTLYMLDLAGIPLTAAERGGAFPIVMAGGPGCANPEPIRDFFDLIVIGDGEEVLSKLADIYVALKEQIGVKTTEKRAKLKLGFLAAADMVRGVYVPSLNAGGCAHPVQKAVVQDLDNAPFPTCSLVSSIEAVHDRGVLELFRGCTRGCRFCQAGYFYRPIRERSVDTLVSQAEHILASTGYEELSMSSLSSGDYPRVRELVGRLGGLKERFHATFSLPSLRVDSFESDIAATSRVNSLTFAPEAGTQRLRDVINKNVTEQNILDSCRAAFERGYATVKLYFMLGLPTETDADVDGIVALCKTVLALYKQYKTNAKRLALNVSTAVFIPKPFTPFQWEPQENAETVKRKQDKLKFELKRLGVTYSYHDCEQSRIEAAVARGGAEINAVILKAYKNGCKFDGWSEYFDYQKWSDAFMSEGVSIDTSVGAREEGAALPWDFVDIGVTKDFFLRERKNAVNGVLTPDCRKKCLNCGVKNIAECSACADGGEAKL